MGFSDGQDIYGQLKSTQPIRLSWTHYSIILQEPNTEARAWYEREAAREMWSGIQRCALKHIITDLPIESANHMIFKRNITTK